MTKYVSNVTEALKTDLVVEGTWSGNIVPVPMSEPDVDLPLTNTKLVNKLDGPLTFSRAGTSTVTNVSGDLITVPADEPACNEDGIACFEAVTNKALYSEDFSQTPWNSSGNILADRTTDGTLSPDGSTLAYLVTDSSTTGKALLIQNIGSQPSGTYNISFFLKKSDSSIVSIASNNSQGFSAVSYNFDTGVATNNNSYTLLDTIIKVKNVGNGWVRLSYTVPTPTTGGMDIRVYPIDNATSDNSDIGSVYVWGAQVTQTSYLAPYIPTQNALVTRPADNVSIPVSGNLPAAGEPFTIVCDAALPEYENHNLALFGLTGENYSTVLGTAGTSPISLGCIRSSNNTIKFQYDDSSGVDKFTVANGVDTSLHRFTCLYDGVTTTKLFVDGIMAGVSTDNGDKNLDGQSYIRIGQWSQVATLNSYLKNFKIYNKALTDQQIAALGGAE